MTDQQLDLRTHAAITLTRDLAAGGEVTIDVSITAPAGRPELHAAHVLNAIAAAADTGLRATDTSHPAHNHVPGGQECGLDCPANPFAGQRSAQCGRTFVHAGHDTTEGRCYGLTGEEVVEQPTLLDVARGVAGKRRRQDVPTEVVAPIVVTLPAGWDPAKIKIENLPEDGRGVLIIPEGITWDREGVADA